MDICIVKSNPNESKGEKCTSDNRDLEIKLDSVVRFDIAKLANRMITEEIKILLFFCMNDRNELIHRESIEFTNFEFPEELHDQEISLKVKVTQYKKPNNSKEECSVNSEKKETTTISLGKFIVLGRCKCAPSTDRDSMFQKMEKADCTYENAPWNCNNKDDSSQLHTIVNIARESYANTDNVLEKYKCGLLKVYYDFLYHNVSINNTERIAGKASAMCSYLAIRNYLNEFFIKNNMPYEVSNPNVFINNKNVEYDALIINKCKTGTSNNDAYFFDENVIEATIEIKTAGFFSKTDNLQGDFVNYVKKERCQTSDNSFIKHIYFSIYEVFGDKANSRHLYELLYSLLKSKQDPERDSEQDPWNVYGIFCGVKRKSDVMIIPYDYDLDSQLSEIFDIEKVSFV